ncbi:MULTISPECIES: hypothetical protein [Lactobacillus]|uniref:Uncharacterized protein n=1 Tax=Lactobacillus panisapium TaxID=2012495 RepID=A0ABX8W9D9_9LACO|nr:MULTISPECIES: hypothetical protein [Lactobacillus]MCO6531184.1 hypothetical protein [Lactobacillus sp.]MCO6533311.1 hypothetical protein [Lactobacillus sp.]MCT6853824.1 hypothetical protein [Lactobacillus panisapium]MCX8726137.1 hypothetical protein [Lactobacillus sp. B4007]MCX8735739.1 hypothetical protein [Lactobacillus sp. B4026]
MLLTENLSTLLKGNYVVMIAGIILLVLGVVELLLSIKNMRNLKKPKGQVGFAPISMVAALFIGVFLVLVGLMFLVASL